MEILWPVVKKQIENKGEEKRESLRVRGVFIPTASCREKSSVTIQMVVSNNRWREGPKNPYRRKTSSENKALHVEAERSQMQATRMKEQVGRTENMGEKT